MKKLIEYLVVGFLIVTPQMAGAEVIIMPHLSTGIEHTDNLYLAPDSEESDTITTVSPGVTVEFSGRTAALSASYAPSYTMYDKLENSDYWEHAVGLTGWWQATRHLRWEASHDYLRTEDPVSEEDLTIRRSIDVHTRNTTSTRMHYQFGVENTLYADGSYSSLDNDDPTIIDSKEYGGGAGVTYWFNVRWGLDVGTDYSEAKYDDGLDDYTEIGGRSRLNHRFNPHFTGFLEYQYTRHRPDEGTEDDYKVHGSGIGFDYAVDPTMDFSMSVHYLIRDQQDGENETETPVNLSLNKRFQRGSISLSGAGGYDYTAVTAENLGVYMYYEAAIAADYAFTSRLAGDLNGTYGYHDYQETTPHRKDDVFRAGCGLSFQVLRWLSMRAGYTYRTVSSTVDTNDYKENRVSLMLTLAPPRPYRF
ncbi:outer membrane beta-barrel protein [Desulfosarcina ovata]|uniref:Outer membrane protein beta-barrel domain-containing protein n=1 Tax=Desulfosarcina ovata subsp. ovata TaxID=2752305 RepID=A0A5K8A7Z1_9BACT|nr:outer membrane beta-barrel protein [Desulfosarcina ovata]BBO88601.1 hypothetical protein DSCOOX_17810 [Desulfosarcina ovata subsp. ovata]